VCVCFQAVGKREEILSFKANQAAVRPRAVDLQFLLQGSRLDSLKPSLNPLKQLQIVCLSFHGTVGLNSELIKVDPKVRFGICRQVSSRSGSRSEAKRTTSATKQLRRAIAKNVS